MSVPVTLVVPDDPMHKALAAALAPLTPAQKADLLVKLSPAPAGVR